MKNRIKAILMLIILLSCIVYTWEEADETMKDIMFYGLLFSFILSAFWDAFKNKKSSRKDDDSKE
ncbi:hypothetical protein BIT28_00195 [Photobacterium proteolyticum]|uniref:Lipoprotein n=1 Tax=Photobacterium proteolyticum TaxID=1903952 RepID=A0A1Q9GTC6_9GAMM|nr:hypothetical protein [Photobacterium proteolyticum]OLQ78348.1 hypothetical protein BIT28_00195 [Photobacterium proteolyticum]